MAKTGRLSGIYALALDGVVFYVGQSIDIHKRYNQHCSMAQNRSDTKKSLWIRGLLEDNCKPDIMLIEETDDLDVREIHWIQHFRSLNQAVLNMADGGKNMTYLRKMKEGKPWGQGLSPVQRRLMDMKRTIRMFERHGLVDNAERIRKLLKRVENSIELVGRDEMNMRLWEKYGKA